MKDCYFKLRTYMYMTQFIINCARMYVCIYVPSLLSSSLFHTLQNVQTLADKYARKVKSGDASSRPAGGRGKDVGGGGGGEGGGGGV